MLNLNRSTSGLDRQTR